MHASGNSRRDGPRDGALHPQSWCETAHLSWNSYSCWLRAYSNSLRCLSDAVGREMAGARYRRPSRASIARLDLKYVGFHRYPVSQYGGTHYRTRSRCFRNQHFTRARRHVESHAETRRLSQTRSDAAGRIYLFRSSQWSRPDPNGDGLGSGKSAEWGISDGQKCLARSLRSRTR